MLGPCLRVREAEKFPFFQLGGEKPYWQIVLMMLWQLYGFHLGRVGELLRAGVNPGSDG